MIPLKTFVSERQAANLLAQIRCRAESAIRYVSYRVFQRYLCKDCGRTFNDKTGTVFKHSTIPLRKWYLAVYTYIRLNTSIRQFDAELAVSYKTVYRRVQRPQEALDAPRPQFEGPVEIDELYVSAGKKGRKRDRPSRSRGLSMRGRGSYHEDKPPVFILADRGTGETYVHPAKAADESTIRLLLGDCQQESLTVYTDGFRAYEPLAEDDTFDRQYVVHDEGEYADGDVHVNTYDEPSSRTDDLLSVAADKAFRNWITKYEFYALGVKPLILQRGSKSLTLGHNALIQSKGYSQRWMAETSYSTTKRSLGDAVRALGWYRQFREIVLMFAICNIEPLCESL